ncbi:response regulator [Telmatocola sphagniphila]|jgi:DNA-binding response OmpR family regulator|uniref:Response regulator n=1 Tax=Telmatocola sphagniphila TaxID=1123043 RepID=A0A8E6EV09_9BACT|nr:response regulator [Telmatocola sphagniphila]QVL34339.1 response regulator [Telmatocola sphagniphila]
MSSPQASETKPFRVLLADDNPHGLELLEAYLAATPYEIRTVNNGESALQAIRDWQPHIVLLDIMMPRLSGFEVCKCVRADPQMRQTGVIVVSALDQHSDIDKAVDAGADDFLTKPINQEDLLNRIRSLLESRDGKDDIERTLAYVQSVESAINH